MKTDEKIIFWLYRINWFLLICWGARAWFTWFLCDTNNPTPQNAYYLLSCILAYLYNKYILHAHLITGKNLLTLFLLCFANNIHDFSLASVLVNLVRFFPLIVLINDKLNARSHLRFIARTLATILIPGLILHIIYLTVGLPLTIPIAFPTMELYSFFNYIFVLKGALDYEANSLRFQSIFLEPGYLGCLCVFILYARKFDFSYKENIIMLGLLASMSLAGYIIGIMAYLITLIIEHREKVRFLVIACILILIYFIAPILNNGNNVINTQIVERLQYDKEKGIVGNNRVSSFTDDYYNYFFTSGDLIWGIGSSKVEKINGGGANVGSMSNQIRGAGYKVFFIINGIVCALLYLWVYILIIPSMPKRYKTNHLKLNYENGFLFIIAVTFVQVAYPWSWAWLCPYVLGLNANFADRENNGYMKMERLQLGVSLNKFR